MIIRNWPIEPKRSRSVDQPRSPTVPIGLTDQKNVSFSGPIDVPLDSDIGWRKNVLNYRINIISDSSSNKPLRGRRDKKGKVEGEKSAKSSVPFSRSPAPFDAYHAGYHVIKAHIPVFHTVPPYRLPGLTLFPF